MASPATSDPTRRTLPRWLGLLALAGLVLWLLFFDSHSVVKRVGWHQELAALEAENAALEARIEQLEAQLEEVAADDVVEQIAREQYGMRRPGETVYRVAEAGE